MKLAFPFVLVVALIAGESAAQAVDTVRALDPVVITGTIVEVTRHNAPLSVSMVTSEEIRESGESNLLPVLSGRVPGLFVTERGVTGFGVANGSAGQITVRGVGSSPNTQVLVLIDGHPQFMGLMGHPLADTYTSSSAERVEVVRGPASVLYGTGAMGGVVNIITRRPSQPGLSLDARASYGSYATRKISAGVGYSHGPWETYVTGNTEHTDGHRPFSQFDLKNGYARAGYRLSDAYRVVIDGGLSGFQALDPGTAGAPASIRQNVDVLRGRTSASLFNRNRFSEGAVRLFYGFGDHEIYDGFQSTDYNGGVMVYQGFRYLPGGVVTLGLDYKRYGGNARNAARDFGRIHVDEAAAYALVQQHLGRILLNAGARVDHHNLYGTELAPQAGVILGVTQTTSVKANVARGFRSPTIRELYLFPAPNPDLEPERMWNYEAGILHTFERGSVEFVGFISEGSNLIMVEGAPPLLRTVNSGEFRNRGIEINGAVHPHRLVRLSGTWSYLDTNTPLTAAPEHQVFAEASIHPGMFGGALQLHHVRNLVTRLPTARQTLLRESYTLLNARVSFAPTASWSVFARVENLLDQDYQINFDYPMPGRTFFTGVSFRY